LTFLTSSRYCDFKVGLVSQCLLDWRSKKRAPINTASDVCSAGAMVPVGRSKKEKETGDAVVVSVHEPIQVKELSLDER